VLEERLGLATIARAGGMDDQQPRAAGAGQVKAYFAESAGTAAKFLARADGPRIGALAFDGWDTHADEGTMSGRLAMLLGALDGALAAIETEMKEAWRETVVAVITEFGRTARINGTEGTDHGTATGRAARGRRAQGRPRRRRLAGPQARQPARRPRPQADDRPAGSAQGPAQGPTCASTTPRSRPRSFPTAAR